MAERRKRMLRQLLHSWSLGWAQKFNPGGFITESASRALLYLRVSTPHQLRPDIGPEGLSIPAQRQACQRAAEHDDLTIVDEYIEPGRSGRTITQRPVLQELLERVRTDADVTHVIVYELSRLARNRADDIRIVTELTAHDVTLISATENVDATPVGQLTHGLLAAVNEYRSARDGADIAYKMGEKAKRGGTLGRAPIGYTNTLVRRDGHDSRSIDVDPIRGPLIRRAFELFATDRYGYEQLANLMLEHGLSRKSRPDSTTPRSIGKTGIARLLTSRYYLGLVTHAGTERTGQHPALVDQQLFDDVQMLISRRRARGQRRRKLDHYLKGIRYCDTCLQDSNRTRVLSYTETTGRSGRRFRYFYCAKRGKRRHTAYIPARHAEQHVVAIWNGLRLTTTYQAMLQDILDLEPVTQRPGRRYRSETTDVRRTMNQALFASIHLPARKVQRA